MDIGSRIAVLKAIFSNKTYVLIAFIIFIIYAVLNILLNQFQESIPLLHTYRLSIVVPFLALSVLIGILVAINITIIIYKLRMVSSVKSDAGATGLGLFGGLLGGACPGCFVGLLPTLAGVFGITVTLSSLPFLGFELQIPTILILLGTLYFIAKPETCKIDLPKEKVEPLQPNS